MPSDREPDKAIIDILTELAAQARAEGFRDGIERAAQGIADAALLEVLADAEHARWSDWMHYQETAPLAKRMDWARKAGMTYWALTNEEQESDRIEARKTLVIFTNFIRALAPVPDSHPVMETMREIGALPGMQEALRDEPPTSQPERSGGEGK